MNTNRKRPVRTAHVWLIALLLIALLADFLANDRPLVASVEGELRFPVLHAYGEDLGLASPYQPVVRNWYRTGTDWALWPPVPHAAGKPDVRNANFSSPFAAQDTGPRARHYLGTDRLGRDVLAGLIRGTRVAIFVGLGSVLLSLLIGIPLGGVAGFFGNDGWRTPRYRLWGWPVGGLLGVGYGAVSLAPFLGATSGVANGLVAAAAGVTGAVGLGRLLRPLPRMRKTGRVPADTVVLQGVELFVNIPGLVLLISLIAIVDRPSIAVVVAIIGVLLWPTVARYLRAELLRIRRLPYIDAARVSGVPPWRILFRHALPNALGPLLVVASFSLGGAILLEASLSFLGIGIPADQVTWGSLLSQSRQHPEAWWLVVFPGVMLTGTVLAASRVRSGS